MWYLPSLPRNGNVPAPIGEMTTGVNAPGTVIEVAVRSLAA